MSTRTDRAGRSDVASAAPSIDAVFLTSNAREQALRCIAHLREPEIATIVAVNNASCDGTAEAIRNAYPDVTVLALDSPMGLAAALNRGADLCNAPFVLYLNDDVFAAPGSIRRLLETLQDRPDAVAAAGRLVEHDLTTQERYRPQPFPSPLTVVSRLLGLRLLWPRVPSRGTRMRRVLDDDTTVAVEQLAGACMLVRRSAVNRIGGWDERYWFWYEDVDFCRRLAAHGTQLYVPTAPFRHVGGSTARRLRRPEGHARFFHGVLLYAQTHFSRPGRVVVAVTLAAVGLARALIAMRSDREGARMYAATARKAAGVLAGRRMTRPPPAPQGGQPRPSGPTSADTRCPVCGAATAISERFRPTVLCVCAACGLLFRSDARDDDVLRMYSDDLYTAQRMDALTRHRDHDARLRARWTRARVSGSRLLDVGAGAGHFVARAADYGFDAIGVEPSELSAGYARAQLGVDVRTGSLDTADLPENAFDAVCMWHVLEHVADPLSLLRGVRERLRAGGRLVIEVPNIDSVGASIMRGGWAHLDPTAHVCHFGPRSLTVALEAAGYAVVELETLVEGYYDRLSMRLRPRRLAGRAVRAVRLRTLAQTHPSRGELLRVVAAPAR